MLKKAAICACIAYSVMGLYAADKQIPSMHPPRGMDASKAPVFVLLGFDDNPYTGQSGSVYFPSGSWQTSTATPADGWASKWITDKLVGGSRATNSDGSPAHVSFYCITGQTGTLDSYGATGVKWGREFTQIPVEYKRLASEGHEVANHTIDHLEVNVYSKHDAGQDPNCLGMSMNPNTYCTLGGKSYYSDNSTQYPGSKGWMDYAGRELDVPAWKECLQRAHDFMKANTQIECSSFRAPRLEFNGSLFNALKEINYKYDITLEEGMQYNQNAQNMIWPYTTDLGMPGLWVGLDYTDDAANDPVRKNTKDFPEGLWEIPTYVVIVPEHLRAAIAERVVTNKIQDQEIADAFVADGKISGLDFNLYIDWLCTPAEWLEIMKYNLDERIAGNHAPIVYGCHSQYYHPAYDFETLQMDTKYKVVLNYNKYDTRAKAFEDFVDYCKTKNMVRVVSGAEYIDWASNPTDIDGNTYPVETPKLAASDIGALTGWVGETDELQSVANPSVSGSEITANFTVKKPANTTDADETNDLWPSPAIVNEVTGDFSKLEGISFDIKTSHWVRVGVRCEIAGKSVDYTFQVNHLSSTARNTGFIPLRDLELDQWTEAGLPTEVPVDSIKAIVIQPNIPSQYQDENVTATISNFKMYGAAPLHADEIAVADQKGTVSAFKLGNVNSNGLSFSAPAAGNYSVALYGMNGKLVQKLNRDVTTSGLVNMSFTSKLVPGMYVVKLNGVGSRELTAKVAIGSVN